jgi:CheY-like chemotaxis protein
MMTRIPHVLLAEDDRLLRTAGATALRRQELRVTIAANGAEAVALARLGGADLILLDLIMPGVDGFEALRRLKEDRRTRAIPVIVLSNLGRDEDIQRALAGGAGSFLIKSDLSLDDLVAHVKQALAAPAMPDTAGDLEAIRPRTG